MTPDPPPTHDDLTGWAEHVTRATRDVVATWRLPEDQKSMLVSVGVPVVEGLIECAAFQAEPDPALRTASGIPLYRMTVNRQGDPDSGLEWVFGVVPDTGTVYYVLPDGEAWFANSSVELWLRALHHYGLSVSRSPVLADPDDFEDEALAELGEIAADLKRIDPPAFDGHQGLIWPEFLDRWLW
ncbi:SUKH-4 family immunity protein [Saccharothrix deserti]|uniref:SUKH-4 family immunity protein n=1 Tax=Saccharothrix deserti TaxID=2593674 RepID=UPI00192E5C3D|nr:SUKH-4 family immunity protein [Saccharothrix deserti]